MNIPTLPTDNLYKFITVLGAALVAFSVWLRSDISDKIDFALSDSDGHLRSISIESKDINDRQKRLLQLGRDLIKSDPKPEDAEAFRKSADEFSREGDSLSAAIKNMEIKFAEMKSFHERTGVMIEKENRLKPSLNFAFYFGWTMFIGGMISWYWNHQRHQDRLVRLEAASKAQADKTPPAHP